MKRKRKRERDRVKERERDGRCVHNARTHIHKAQTHYKQQTFTTFCYKIFYFVCCNLVTLFYVNRIWILINA